jgi:hypothetical protein
MTSFAATAEHTALESQHCSVPRPEPILLPQIEEGCADEHVVAGVLAHRFDFGGERHDLGAAIDWLHNPSADVEWHILLHKFYFAVGLAERYRTSADERLLACFVELVTSWLAQTPPTFIAVDVTARRVQNWIYAWYVFKRAGARFPQGFELVLRSSLEEQVNAVIVELAPARNHRTLELYAVFLFCVAFPSGTRSSLWLEFAVREMAQNIYDDLLPDGVQCELSTDYHHIVLRNYLLFYDLARRNGIALPRGIESPLCKALDFAMHIHRPDGAIPAISDGDSRSYTYLLEWGARLFAREDYRFVATGGEAGTPPRATNVSFDVSGYHVQRSAWGLRPYADARYLAFDCGPIGAGNHGHLDALSIEVAAYGRPLVIDPGRFTYLETGEMNWRARFRGTAAHNTVTVDGRDQAIYRRRGSGGKSKIAAPHPTATLVASESRGSIARLHGRITSPNYDAVHERHVLFVRELYWVIVDVLLSATTHDYCANFQLTPAAVGRLILAEESGAARVDSTELCLVFLDAAAETRLEDGHVSSLYGIKEDAPRICVRRRAANTRFVTFLLPYQDTSPELSLRRVGDTQTVAIRYRDLDDRWSLDAQGLEWASGGARERFAIAKESACE